MTTFRISFPYMELSKEQIWPDGDGPDDPTPQDVMKVMDHCGGLLGVLSDWNLVPYIEINNETYQ